MLISSKSEQKLNSQEIAIERSKMHGSVTISILSVGDLLLEFINAGIEVIDHILNLLIAQIVFNP
jgi:hypothetical protein